MKNPLDIALQEAMNIQTALLARVINLAIENDALKVANEGLVENLKNAQAKNEKQPDPTATA